MKIEGNDSILLSIQGIIKRIFFKARAIIKQDYNHEHEVPSTDDDNDVE